MIQEKIECGKPLGQEWIPENKKMRVSFSFRPPYWGLDKTERKIVS